MRKNEELKELFKNMDVEDLMEVVQDINHYDGSLDWLNYQVNDEDFFEIYFSKADDAVRAVCYGDYNYADDYVKFDGYGNLESCSKYDLEEELKSNIDEIEEKIIDLKNDITFCNDDINKILNNKMED